MSMPEEQPGQGFSVHHCHDLKPQHRYMLSCLIDNARDWADHDGWVKFGRRSLADRLCLDHATVRRLIKALDDAGYLEVETGGGAQKFSRYRLSQPAQGSVLNAQNEVFGTQSRVKNDSVASCNKAKKPENHGVISDTVLNSGRGNIVSLYPQKTAGNSGKVIGPKTNRHRVTKDSYRLDSDSSSKDSNHLKPNNPVDMLTDLFLTERQIAHPDAMTVSRSKTRQAVERCLQQGIAPDRLASNIRHGMLRGKFKNDPPSSPLAFKRSAEENWGAAHWADKSAINSRAASPGSTNIGQKRSEIDPSALHLLSNAQKQQVFERVCQSLRFRCPQKLAGLTVADISGWAAFVRPDMLA